jgi:SAM-dependent methyltransferase
LICGSKDLIALYKNVRDHYHISGKEYDFLRCINCSSATIYPLPSQEEIHLLYPENYTFKKGRGKNILNVLLNFIEWHLFYNPIFNHRVKTFMRVTGLRSGLILDVGCGSGILMKKLSDRGFNVEGVEISESDIDYVREAFGYNVFHGTLKEAGLKENYYDAVILFYLLEHLFNPAEAGKEIFRILKPGGWIVVAVPLIDSWQATFFREKWSQIAEAPRHISIPSKKGITGLLLEAGFKEVKMAPVSIFDIAGFIAISFFPKASVTLSYGQSSAFKLIIRKFTGGLITLVSLPIALVERIFSKSGCSTGGMMFFGRK